MNERDFVEVGLSCADICNALGRGVGGKKLDDLSQSMCEAINQLTMWVKPVVQNSDNSSTTLLITELWRRSKGR